MSKYQIINRENFGNSYWTKAKDYLFASGDPLVPLVVNEAPTAMMWMALGFIRHEDGLNLVGIQSLGKAQNLFVDAAGNWLAEYVPAFYRSYPFKVALVDDVEYLSVDGSSSLLNQAGEGHRFYDAAGQAAPEVMEVLTFLKQIRNQSETTRRLCQLLDTHGVLEDWPIRVEAERNMEIKGLLRVSETRLNQLPADAFIELRDNGALLLAYCQMLSMQNLAMLAKLAAAHGRQSRIDTKAMLENHGTISFSNL